MVFVRVKIDSLNEFSKSKKSINKMLFKINRLKKKLLQEKEDLSRILEKHQVERENIRLSEASSDRSPDPTTADGGSMAFELEKDSKIYIYSNLIIGSPIKLDIYGYNLTDKINCLNTEFKHNYLIEMNNLDERCNRSFYFQGKIKDYNGEQYFYFALNNKIKNNSKNLIVLPVTNFFDYSSNIWGISSATSKLNFIPFIKNSNGNFPIAKKIRWSEHTHDSIKNLIVQNFL